MSMNNDMVRGEQGDTEKCVQLRIMLANSCPDVGHPWDLDQRRNGTKLALKNGTEWDKIAEVMMLCLHSESCHPTYRATSALGRGELRSEGKGQKSFQYNYSEETIVLILRTIISVNQLSIYGTASDSCKELSDDSEVAQNLQQMKIRNQWTSLLNFLLLTLTPTRSRRETCCKTMNISSNNFLKTKSYPNYAAMQDEEEGTDGMKNSGRVTSK